MRLPSRQRSSWLSKKLRFLIVAFLLLIFYTNYDLNVYTSLLESTDCDLADEDCLLRTAQSLSYPWTPHKIDSELVLIKVPKSASSTAAGIVLRIQAHTNLTVQWHHQKARDVSASTTAIRIAPIRQPESRAVSSYFFHHVTFHGQQRDAVQRLQADNLDNFILDYTSPVVIVDDIVDTVRKTVQHYHFLWVVERLDESLVVWAWLSGLPYSQLLSTHTKQAGSWYASGKRCVRLAETNKTIFGDHFDSRAWKASQAGDRLLYAVAGANLERTIDAMGRAIFARELVKFRKLQQQVYEACDGETYFPCSDTGELQLELSQKNCYLRDFGCGYPCVDRVVGRGGYA